MSAILEAMRRYEQRHDCRMVLRATGGGISLYSLIHGTQTFTTPEAALGFLNACLPESERVPADADADQSERIKELERDLANYENAAYWLAEIVTEQLRQTAFWMKSSSVWKASRHRRQATLSETQQQLLAARTELQGKDDAIAELRRELAGERLLIAELQAAVAAVENPEPRDELAEALVEASKRLGPLAMTVERDGSGLVVAGDGVVNRVVACGRTVRIESIHTAAATIRSHLSRVTLSDAQAALASGKEETVLRYFAQQKGGA